MKTSRPELVAFTLISALVTPSVISSPPLAKVQRKIERYWNAPPLSISCWSTLWSRLYAPNCMLVHTTSTQLYSNEVRVHDGRAESVDALGSCEIHGIHTDEQADEQAAREAHNSASLPHFWTESEVELDKSHNVAHNHCDNVRTRLHPDRACRRKPNESKLNQNNMQPRQRLPPTHRLLQQIDVFRQIALTYETFQIFSRTSTAKSVFGLTLA